MKAMTLRSLAAGLLIVGLLAGVVPKPAQAATPTVVIAAPGDQGELSTDGWTVVWTDNRDPVYWQVFGAKLSDGKEFGIATKESGRGYQVYPSVGSGFAMWDVITGPKTPDEIHVKNLATGKEVVLGNGSGANISGSRAAYISYDKLYDPKVVKVRDISVMGPEITVIEPRPDVSIGNVLLDGNRVAWLESTEKPLPDGKYTHTTRVMTKIVGDEQAVVVSESTETLEPGASRQHRKLDMQGNLIVYLDNSQVQLYKIDTGEKKTISGPVSDLFDLTTDRRYIFWSRLQGGSISGYDTAHNRQIEVPVDTKFAHELEARGGWIVWNGAPRNPVNDRDTRDIYAARISDLLPTGPLPQEPSTPDRYYFKETGHTLAYGFKYFWDHSGGLPVFGYPLTEEFTENNRDTGKDYTVQYFERQRFEYHPEFKGTRYETSLGRLGAEDAYTRGITATDAFRPRTADSPNSATQQFFPETDHWVSQSFLAYWKSHGLDFGDPSVSYRESLALFGLPLSEEFVDPETGFVTQYFERAVFEYHPENKGTAYEVQLRLLGRGLLEGRGWL